MARLILFAAIAHLGVTNSCAHKVTEWRSTVFICRRWQSISECLELKTLALRDAALALHRGGVGYYEKSDFVHVDVG